MPTAGADVMSSARMDSAPTTISEAKDRPFSCEVVSAVSVNAQVPGGQLGGWGMGLKKITRSSVVNDAFGTSLEAWDSGDIESVLRAIAVGPERTGNWSYGNVGMVEYTGGRAIFPVTDLVPFIPVGWLDSSGLIPTAQDRQQFELRLTVHMGFSDNLPKTDSYTVPTRTATNLYTDTFEGLVAAKTSSGGDSVAYGRIQGGATSAPIFAEYAWISSNPMCADMPATVRKFDTFEAYETFRAARGDSSFTIPEVVGTPTAVHVLSIPIAKIQLPVLGAATSVTVADYARIPPSVCWNEDSAILSPASPGGGGGSGSVLLYVTDITTSSATAPYAYKVDVYAQEFKGVDGAPAASIETGKYLLLPYKAEFAGTDSTIVKWQEERWYVGQAVEGHYEGIRRDQRDNVLMYVTGGGDDTTAPYKYTANIYREEYADDGLTPTPILTNQQLWLSDKIYDMSITGELWYAGQRRGNHWEGIKKKSIDGLTQGFGLIKFTDPVSGAELLYHEVMQLNGHQAVGNYAVLYYGVEPEFNWWRFQDNLYNCFNHTLHYSGTFNSANVGRKWKWLENLRRVYGKFPEDGSVFPHPATSPLRYKIQEMTHTGWRDIGTYGLPVFTDYRFPVDVSIDEMSLKPVMRWSGRILALKDDYAVNDCIPVFDNSSKTWLPDASTNIPKSSTDLYQHLWVGTKRLSSRSVTGGIEFFFDGTSSALLFCTYSYFLGNRFVCSKYDTDDSCMYILCLNASASPTITLTVLKIQDSGTHSVFSTPGTFGATTGSGSILLTLEQTIKGSTITNGVMVLPNNGDVLHNGASFDFINISSGASGKLLIPSDIPGAVLNKVVTIPGSRLSDIEPMRLGGGRLLYGCCANTADKTWQTIFVIDAASTTATGMTLFQYPSHDPVTRGIPVPQFMDVFCEQGGFINLPAMYYYGTSSLSTPDSYSGSISGGKFVTLFKATGMATTALNLNGKVVYTTCSGTNMFQTGVNLTPFSDTSSKIASCYLCLGTSSPLVADPAVDKPLYVHHNINEPGADGTDPFAP